MTAKADPLSEQVSLLSKSLLDDPDVIKFSIRVDRTTGLIRIVSFGANRHTTTYVEVGI